MSYEIALRKWVSELRDSEINKVLEFLHGNGLLSENGDKVARGFWEKYIKEKTKEARK